MTEVIVEQPLLIMIIRNKTVRLFFCSLLIFIFVVWVIQVGITKYSIVMNYLRPIQISDVWPFHISEFDPSIPKMHQKR